MRNVRRNRVAPCYIDLRVVGASKTLTSEWRSNTRGCKRKKAFATTVALLILVVAVAFCLYHFGAL